MADELDRIGRQYAAALDAFLRMENEALLSRAYELGRQALVDGLGVLDMASMHHAAFAVLVAQAPPPEQVRLGQSAARFLTEILSPFEISLRGYRAANQVLQQMNKSLRQQKEAAEIANRELEAFSYSVAHDLGAPLRAVDAWVTALIEDSDALAPEAMARFERVRDGVSRMRQVIHDLLRLSRVVGANLQRQEFDLSALAGLVGASLIAFQPDHAVELVVWPGMRCNGDRALLQIVLENLLGNAWKFTRRQSHPRVEVGTAAQGDASAFFVRDNGAGFDMEKAHRLFLPFERLHSEAEYKGTGVGLATVRRVIQRHDGRVWAESRLGDGATFYFTLGDRQSPP